VQEAGYRNTDCRQALHGPFVSLKSMPGNIPGSQGQYGIQLAFEVSKEVLFCFSRKAKAASTKNFRYTNQISAATIMPYVENTMPKAAMAEVKWGVIMTSIPRNGCCRCNSNGIIAVGKSAKENTSENRAISFSFSTPKHGTVRKAQRLQPPDRS